MTKGLSKEISDGIEIAFWNIVKDIAIAALILCFIFIIYIIYNNYSSNSTEPTGYSMPSSCLNGHSSIKCKIYEPDRYFNCDINGTYYNFKKEELENMSNGICADISFRLGFEKYICSYQEANEWFEYEQKIADYNITSLRMECE